MRVRILLWALKNKTWLGRQLADHFGSGTDRRLVAEMLRVRIPPELLAINTSSWSSGVLACLSRRRSWVQIPSGTLDNYGAVRKPVKRRSSNLRDRLWVRLPPVLLKQNASIGHWQAQVAVTHPLSSFAGSTPARRTDNTARSSSGRMRDPHSRDMGSIPIRVTDNSVAACLHATER